MFLNGGLCPALQYSIRPCFRSYMQMNMVTSRKGTKNVTEKSSLYQLYNQFASKKL